MYCILVNPDANAVESIFAGFLSVAEIAAYDVDLQKRFDQGHLTAGYRMLLDVSGCPIQPREVIAAFQTHVEGCPKASCIAVVAGGSMVRMQVRRILAQPYTRIFDTRSEAQDWRDQRHEPRS